MLQCLGLEDLRFCRISIPEKCQKQKQKQKKQKTPGLCEILGGVCDRVVNTSNPRIWRSGVQASPAALFPWLQTLLHFVSLHPGVQMGTGNILLGEGGGGNPALD